MQSTKDVTAGARYPHEDCACKTGNLILEGVGCNEVSRHTLFHWT